MLHTNILRKTLLICPILEYGDILFDNISLSLAQSLEKVQRRAALICVGAYRHTEHRLLLSEIGWDELRTRRRLHRLHYMYKVIKNIYPTYIKDLFTKKEDVPYVLRNRTTYRPRFSRLSISYNFYIPRTTRDWNNLPSTVRDASSFNIFKKLLYKGNRPNLYNSLCTGRPGVWLSRLHMGLSGLNYHRFSYNFIEDPNCQTCGVAETVTHYFCECTPYQVARQNLYARLESSLGLNTTNTEIY